MHAMKSKLKIIVSTAIGTTLFWVALFAILFWFGASSEHYNFALDYHTNKLGVLWISNSDSQKVVALIENFGGEPTNYVAAGSPVLKQELLPGQYIRLGVRTVRESNSDK
jgi:hypothetical protein